MGTIYHLCHLAERLLLKGKSKFSKTLPAVLLNSLLGVAGTAVYCGGANAADLSPAPLPPSPTYDFWTSPHLFGDWNGMRTMFHDKGVDFQLGYVGETVTNWRGGTHQQVDNAGQFLLGTTFDLQRLFGLDGGLFQVSITERNGRSLTNDVALGALQEANEIYGRGDIFRLTQFFYDQKFDNGAIDFKVGRMPFSDDFDAFSCDFINLTFCGSPPGQIYGSYIYEWPVSQWEGRLRANIAGFGYVQVGVIDVNPVLANEKTLDALAPVFPNGSTGVLVPAEIGWLPTFGQLAGSYKFGVWYDSSMGNDVFYNTNGLPLATGTLAARTDKGRYGGYFGFRQQLTADPTGGDPKHGLFAFLNGTFGDPRTSVINYQVAGGVLYHGPFETRPNDDIGFAIGTTHINPAVAHNEAIANALGTGAGYTQSGELATEVFYAYQATGWLNLKGSLQYIHNPGGTTYYKDALVSGVRVTIDF